MIKEYIQTILDKPKNDYSPFFRETLQPRLIEVLDTELVGMELVSNRNKSSITIEFNKLATYLKIITNFHANSLSSKVLVFYSSNVNEGFSEKKSFAIGLTNGQTNILFRKFDVPVKYLKIDFDTCKFHIQYMKFVKISNVEYEIEHRNVVFKKLKELLKRNPLLVDKFICELKHNGWKIAANKVKNKVVDSPTLSKPYYHREKRKSELQQYVDQVLAISNKPNNLEYVHVATDSLNAHLCRIKMIAFYLPQFHPFPENDKWWGRGFTEWTNVSKSVPQFLGHYQPSLPGELGFYDLRIPEVQQRQVELAKQYGIYGFFFHYYCFGGKRLLEKPVEQYLTNKDLDLPFCLCWANENWTRRWDGSENDILIRQDHSPEDDLALIADLARHFQDPRYIHIDGRPVVIVYRASLLPDSKATVKRWKAYCNQHKIPEPYLVAAQSFEVIGHEDYGFDAAVEFPPHQCVIPEITDELAIINPDFAGKIYDYRHMREYYCSNTKPEFKKFMTVAPAWDNSPRKPGKGHAFAYSSPAEYALWLKQACDFTYKNNQPSERLVFVNAWNEWGEGAYLEPDRKRGYAYLHTTANVLRHYMDNDEIKSTIDGFNECFRKTSEVAILLHLYYEDLFDEFAAIIERAQVQADLFISVRADVSMSTINKIKLRFPNSYIKIISNVGRDINPFMQLLAVLVPYCYEIGIKVHTKKSSYLSNGDEWRQLLVESLLGSKEIVNNNINRFYSDSTLGLICQKNNLLLNTVLERNILNRNHLDQLLDRLSCCEYKGNYDFLFPAGSMFMFRLKAMEPLLNLGIKEDEFELESGQFDGTLAHAIERLFCLSAIKAGYRVDGID